MKKCLSYCLLMGLFATKVQAEPPRCIVQFHTLDNGKSTRPLVDGAEGTIKETVHGFADIPPGTFLWVFAHKKGIHLWWPQGGRSPPIRANEWDVWVQLGRPDREDQGDYEITARVVDATVNGKLENWFSTAAGNDYPPIAIPFSVEGCVIKTITVRRIDR